MSWFKKEEKMNMETGKFEPVEKESKYTTIRNEQTGESVRVRREEKPLTREEQFPPPRKQPWQTPRGKHFIKKTKAGIGRIDKAVVNFNRTRNPMGRQPARRQPRQRMSNYSTHNNYNPFGSMFDTGMDYNPPRKKSSGGKKKYHVSGGVAYPIAGSKKKKKGKKKSSRRSNDWDVFGAFGGYKL